MQMDYMGLLRRSKDIAWQHKKLWVFGFLMALFGGNGSLGWQPNRGGMPPFRQMPLLAGWQFTPGLVAAMVAGGVLVLLIAVAVKMTSSAALMQSVRDADGGRSVGLRRGFGAGFRRLWTYFWVNMAVGLPAVFLSIGLLLLAALPVILATLATRGQPREMWPAVLVTVLLLIPLGLLLAMVYSLLSLALEFMLRACVLERLGVGASLRRGWDLFAKHFWQALVIAVLLFGCGIIFVVVMIPLALGFVGVAVAGGAAVWFAFRAGTAAMIVGGVLLLPGVLVLLTLLGAFKAFTSGAWTLAYAQMAALGTDASAPAAAAAAAPVAAPAEGVTP
jgi:hypothetical protein